METPIDKPLAPKILRAAEYFDYASRELNDDLALTSADTGGQFCAGSVLMGPNDGPPPHVHTEEDEMWLIQEGRFEFLIGEEVIECGPGDIVFAPRGIVHTFRNCGDAAGRLFSLVTGSNFERFYRRWTEMLRETKPDFGAACAMAQEHGITILPRDPLR